MNLKGVIAAAASVFLTANSAFADIVVCPPDEGLRRLEDYNRNFRAEVAGKQEPILLEMQAINAKAKNNSLPIGTQLSKPDLDRFQELREQLLGLQAKDIVNSGYLRDSRVIIKAAKVAYDMSRGRTYDEKDPDFFYYSIVGLLGIQNPGNDVKITTPNDKECSIEAALYFDERPTIKQASDLQPSFMDAIKRLTAIAQRYGLDPKQEGWVEKIRNLDDQQTAQREIGKVEQGNRLLEYINNIENLKALAHVSVLGFQSDLEDIRVAHTEQELSKVGTGWTERAKAYDERTQILAGLLNMIAQKIPSDTMIEGQHRQKVLQQQGIIK